MPCLRASVSVVSLTALLSTLAAASPASDLFSQVAFLLTKNYGGLSPSDRPALLAQAQTDLEAACAGHEDDCPASVAYGVLKDSVRALNDPHSYLNTPEEEVQFQAVASGGSRLQYGFTSAALADNTRVVTDVLDGSPAQAAGLARGDHLVGLNGGPYDHAALARLREAGAALTLTVLRASRTVTLQMQARETSSRNLPHLSWAGDTAVIRIPTFSSGGGIAQRVHDLVREAEDHAARGLVVDLRDNPGGNLYECDLAVTPFVSGVQRSLTGMAGTHTMQAQGGDWLVDGAPAASVTSPQRWDGPLAVLVNEHSASCSEFFALAVQSAHRGVVIGEPTGGVSNTSTATYRLAGGGALHLTAAHFAYPDGQPYPAQIRPDQMDPDDLQALAQGDDCLLRLGLQAVQAQAVPAQGAPVQASAAADATAP